MPGQPPLTSSSLVLTAVMTLVAGCSPAERVVAVGRMDGAVSQDRPGVPFGVPQLITGLVQPAAALQDPTLTADELEMYFSSGNDIWRTIRADIGQVWPPGVRVEELSTTDRDLEPEVSADGLTIYLVRDPMALDPDFRIFVSQRASRSEIWGPPQVLTLGSPNTDRGPTVDRRGLTLVFSSTRVGGEFDLYLVRRSSAVAPWDATPLPLPEVNSGGPDWDPGLFLDGLGLVFGTRPGGASTTTDLFESTRASETSRFAAPTSMTDLNSPMSEGDPWLSNDGRHIVFSSERDGTSRLYEAWR